MKPRLYSRLAIGLCTLFLTPFFGCVLFAANLNETGKGKYSYYFVIGGLCWFSLIVTLTDKLFPRTGILPFFIANALGSVILSYPLWHRFLGQYQEYEKRSVETPVSLFVVLCAIIFLFFLWLGNNWAAA